MSSTRRNFLKTVGLIRLIGGYKLRKNTPKTFFKDPDPAVQQNPGPVYSTYCQSCDEEPGTGPRLTAAVLASRLNAEGLYVYHQLKMPYHVAETLSDEDSLNVTASLHCTRKPDCTNYNTSPTQYGISFTHPSEPGNAPFLSQTMSLC